MEKYYRTEPVIIEKDGVATEYHNIMVFLKDHPELNEHIMITLLNPRYIAEHKSYHGFKARFKNQ